MNTLFKIKLLVALLFAAFAAALLLTDNAANPTARAFSTGPPAGYTHAPGELDCSECHTTPAQSSGTITVTAPQHYTPGVTYDITVTHATQDPSRVRWGFELTALDSTDSKAGARLCPPGVPHAHPAPRATQAPSRVRGGFGLTALDSPDSKAGALAPADGFTQVVNNSGHFPARQYVEHANKDGSDGTFSGQQFGAHWTFKWTAPDADVGPVTFYAAGNQANGAKNSSGDNIYFTFSTATFQPPSPDFSVSVTPTSRTVAQGGGTTYAVAVTPLNGFTGQVTLGVTGLPSNAASGFQPASVNITDANPQSSTLTVSTSSGTPTGSSTLDLSAASGQLSHTTQAALNVVSPTDADLAVAQSVSPNPAQVGADLKFTVTVTNNGPATATGVATHVTLPPNLTSFVKGSDMPSCTLVTGQTEFDYFCAFSNSLRAGESATADFTIRLPSAGTLNTPYH